MRDHMKAIQELVDKIDEELEGAKDYAESYLMCKAKGNSTWSQRYKEMAYDELKHSEYIHDKAVEEIEKLRTVYTAPVDMQEAWDKSHKRYVECASWIKTMLTM